MRNARFSALLSALAILAASTRDAFAFCYMGFGDCGGGGGGGGSVGAPELDGPAALMAVAFVAAAGAALYRRTRR